MGCVRVAFVSTWLLTFVCSLYVAPTLKFIQGLFLHTIGTRNRYIYNGKVLQDQVIGGTTFGWYYYGARFYDPELGRWHTIDPLTEEWRRWSPYNYGVANLLRFTDPDCRSPALVLYLISGVGEVLLATTVAAATTYLVYKAGEATVNLYRDVRQGWKEQRKREHNSQRETAKIVRKHAQTVKKVLENLVQKEMVILKETRREEVE